MATTRATSRSSRLAAPGPLHAVEVADELEIPTVVVPASSGVLSAVGCMMSNVRFDQMRSLLSTLGDKTLERISGLVRELRADIAMSLHEEGFAEDQCEYLISADMRYAGQVHEVNVDLPEAALASAEATADAFHDAHARLYGTPFPGHDIEVVNVRLAGVGVVDGPTLRQVAPVGDGRPPSRSSDRMVIFAAGETTAGVYQREELRAGDRIDGPAVIELMDCTTLITPNRFAVVDDYGAIVIKKVEG